ncbi:MAG: hypothetical protein FWH00_02095, partial [Oscillospiraceae bacterium]|nr:hypothetical protein [Oscillospiraceae bacterium]
MANFLDSLLDKDNPVRKLQKEIEGVEFKKQSLISAVQGEITAAKQKIDNEILQIGGNIYTRYINGTYTDSELAAHFAAIDAGNNTIKENESKIAEIAGRYDEELNLLKMNLAALAPPPQP